jgi:hypothetical protein
MNAGWPAGLPEIVSPCLQLQWSLRESASGRRNLREGFSSLSCAEAAPDAS